ncbi:YoaK family protein [Sinomonas sp. G460-2]|uniref:YoaK family protein n=1 Tax=Sinomonas sp. G460-2 TaxID=3393464 RepID=UPI0039F067EA
MSAEFPAGHPTGLAQDDPNPTGRAGGPQGGRKWEVLDVLALNVATGIVESVCLAHLGGLFAAYVTGTVILAGVHAATGQMAALLPYAVAFAGFLIGGFVGGALVRDGRRPKASYVRALAVEGGSLAAAAGILLVPGIPEEAGHSGSLALLAFGMAVQFSATRHLNVENLRFAAATGLVHSLAHEATAGRGTPLHLTRRLLALATLSGGAAVGALIGRWSVVAAIALATLIVLGSAAVAAVALQRRR